MKNLKKKIEDAYKDHLLTEEGPPTTVYRFMKALKEPEGGFYEHFGSFQQLERGLWTALFAQTLEQMKAEPVYAQYGSREKLLSFYFTLAEHLKAERSLYRYFLQRDARRLHLLPPAWIGGFREHFLHFAQDEVVAQGISGQEISERPLLQERYADLLWAQLLWLLLFWSRDESVNFERTDTAIEKSVHLAFDLMGRNLFDSAFDLTKFLLTLRP